MSNKLFVGGLSPTITATQLTSFFAKAGPVLSVRVISDRMTGKGKGFGFVEMATPEAAQCAIDTLHNTQLEGKAISVREERKVQNKQTNLKTSEQPSHRRKWGLVI